MSLVPVGPKLDSAVLGCMLEPWVAGFTLFIDHLPQFDTKIIVQVRRTTSQHSVLSIPHFPVALFPQSSSIFHTSPHFSPPSYTLNQPHLSCLNTHFSLGHSPHATATSAPLNLPLALQSHKLLPCVSVPLLAKQPPLFSLLLQTWQNK
jgi:hypothetical protein